jgi:signal transduction histidine kinase
MHARSTMLKGFDDLVEEAGFGSWIWNRHSYRAAQYYHGIVAVFTATILFFGFSRLIPIEWVLLFIGVYGAYYVGRKGLNRRAERQFYRPVIQFLRAQIVIVFITATLCLVPGSVQTSLWLLFVPVILLTSKHCNTTSLSIVLAEACAALILVEIYQSAAPPPFIDLFLKTELLVKICWLGLFTFILHFLVRNILARNETIAGYMAVNNLTRDVDMTDAHWAHQWQPLLTAILHHLDGQCASIWVIDLKTRNLQRMASVRRDPEQASGWYELSQAEADRFLSINAESLMAEVARTSEFGFTDRLSAADVRSNCPNISTELAVPINFGPSDRRSTIGVLSVGFRAPAFREYLLSDYRNFIEGLINQAKPMLIYTQRLEELVALQKVSRQISHSLDLDTVLNSILKAAVDTLGFEFATISLVDEEQQLIRTRCGTNVPQGWLDLSVHPLNSNDIQADIVRRGETEIITGWDERFDRRIWEMFDHKNMIRIFTPIEVVDAATQRERVIGTIEAGYQLKTRGEIGPAQRRMLEAFKDQAAIAIEHAQLLERATQRADVLTSLHRVGQVIGSTLDPATVLEEIGHSAQALLRADVVMVYRYYREQKKVEPPVAAGTVWGRQPLNLNLSQESILTRLLQDTQPYYSPDAPTDPQLAAQPTEAEEDGRPKRTFIQRQNIKSFAGIPLVAQGEIVGVMFVNYRARHQFTEHERQLHELFAQQAAVSIRNAENNELARELIVRQERDRLSRELHHTVSQALFATKLMAQNALNDLPAENTATRDDLNNILESAQVASQEASFILDELRAPIEESRHLLTGLEKYADRLKRWYKYQVEIDYAIGQALLPLVEQTLLRFAREALHNSVRHANCRSVRVEGRSDDSRIWITVSDDGVGFDPDRILPGKLGVRSMHELAAKIHGTLEIATAPGHGTHLTLSVQQMSQEN